MALEIGASVDLMFILKHREKDKYYKNWTVKGPSFTDAQADARRFQEREEARMEINRDPRLMAYYPRAVKE